MTDIDASTLSTFALRHRRREHAGTYMYAETYSIVLVLFMFLAPLRFAKAAACELDVALLELQHSEIVVRLDVRGVGR